MKIFHLCRFSSAVQQNLKIIPYSRDQKEVIGNKIINCGSKYYNEGKKLSETKSIQSFSTKLKCKGCGSPFQTKNPEYPGYLDHIYLDLLDKAQSDASKQSQDKLNSDSICFHCENYSLPEGFLSETYQTYLDETIIEDIGNVNRIVLYCVDMSNFPHCISKDTFSLFSNSQFILCLTKCDLNPIDKQTSLNRWKFMVEKRFEEIAKSIETGFSSERILFTCFISSKNGYGIDQLNDFLLSKHFMRQQTSFPIVGCINSGKSSLFNRLLLSDACSPGVRNSIQRSKVSVMPGSTSGVLWFPRNRMTLNQRYFRGTVLKEEKILNKNSPGKNVNGYKIFPEKSVIISSIHDSEVKAEKEPLLIDSVTIKKSSKDVNLTDNGLYFTEKEIYHDKNLSDDLEHSKEYLEPRELSKNVKLLRNFNLKNGFFDTPPVYSDSYLLGTELSKSEYISLFNEIGTFRLDKTPSFIKPRVFSIRQGMVIAISCFSAIIIDKLVNCETIYVNLQTPLPIHIFTTDQMDSYYDQYHNSLLSENVEISTVRREIFTKQIRKNLENNHVFSLSEDSLYSTKPTIRINKEIVLSDLGWLGIAPKVDPNDDKKDSRTISLRVATFSRLSPTRFINIRLHPLLPHVLTRRGNRIPYSREYYGMK